MLDLSQFDGHTPGPWKYTEKVGHPHRFVIGTNEPIGSPGDKFVVAYVVGMDSDANGRLIAAAPELLAEVKRLREQLAWAQQPVNRD